MGPKALKIQRLRPRAWLTGPAKVNSMQLKKDGPARSFTIKYLYVLTSGTSTATSRGTTWRGTPCSTRVPTRFSTIGCAGSAHLRAMIDARDRMYGFGSGEAF